MMQPNMNQSKD